MLNPLFQGLLEEARSNAPIEYPPWFNILRNPVAFGLHLVVCLVYVLTCNWWDPGPPFTSSGPFVFLLLAAAILAYLAHPGSDLFLADEFAGLLGIYTIVRLFGYIAACSTLPIYSEVTDTACAATIVVTSTAYLSLLAGSCYHNNGMKAHLKYRKTLRRRWKKLHVRIGLFLEHPDITQEAVTKSVGLKLCSDQFLVIWALYASKKSRQVQKLLEHHLLSDLATTVMHYFHY